GTNPNGCGNIEVWDVTSGSPPSGGTELGETPSISSVVWQVTVTVPANQATSLAVRCRDDAGNVSLMSTPPVIYNNDSSPPSPPTMNAVSPSSPSMNTSLMLSGTAPAADCPTV